MSFSAAVLNTTLVLRREKSEYSDRVLAGRAVAPTLSPVVLVGLHRPQPLIVVMGVVAVGLRRIAVDQRPHVHRVRGAAHLVLHREQMLAACEIDDVAKAVLVLVVLAVDQAALPQLAVRTGKVG